MANLDFRSSLPRSIIIYVYTNTRLKAFFTFYRTNNLNKFEKTPHVDRCWIYVYERSFSHAIGN